MNPLISITLLSIIWWTSIALAALTTMTMGRLIVQRLYQDRRALKLKERKKTLALLAMIYLDAPNDDRKVKDICRNFDINILHEVVSDLVEGKRRLAQYRIDRDLLREIVHDLLGSVRGASRARLIGLLKETGVHDTCLADINDSQVSVRMAAVETLSLFDEPEIVETLRGALDDPEPYVRLAAAKSLAEIGEGLSIDDLIEKLDIGITVRSRMLREIFRLFAQRNTDDLVRLLEQDPPEMVTALAIYALGTRQDFSLIPAITRHAGSPSIDVRAEAMRALTAIGHPAAEATVLHSLEDESWEVRTEAAICAGRILLSNAVPLLRRRLSDQEWWPRFRAAEALRAIGGPGKRVLENTRQGRGRAAKISDMVLAENGTAA